MDAPAADAALVDAPMDGLVDAPLDAPMVDAPSEPDAGPDLDITGTMDLRMTGAIVPVKNEGGCEAEGLFAITDALSAAWFQTSSVLVSLSEQQILDCYAHECGSAARDVTTLLSAIDGLTNEASYPYTATPGSCRSVSNMVGLASYEAFAPRKQAIGGYIDAGSAVIVSFPVNEAFLSYTGGSVLARTDCTDATDTIVGVIVGYGDDAGTPYWLIKLPWGASFGESGYVRMAREQAASCAFTGDAVVVTAEAP